MVGHKSSKHLTIYDTSCENGPKRQKATTKKMATVLSQWFYQCSQSYFVGETCRRFVALAIETECRVLCGDIKDILNERAFDVDKGQDELEIGPNVT